MNLIVGNLTKQYKDKCAVDGVSFRLTMGINGSLWPNGAGKTTLMRICRVFRSLQQGASL